MRKGNLLKVTDKKQLKNGNLYMENELNLTIYKQQIINRSTWSIKIKKAWQQQIGQLSEEKKQATKC